MDRTLPSPENVLRQMPCLCGLFQLASRSISRVYNEEFRGLGLGATQHAVLKLLKGVGPMAMGELGERLLLDKTTVSRNLKILERNGWAAVERGDDERRRIVAITPKGAAKLAEARPAWERAQERLRAALPAGDFEALRKHLPGVAMAALNA
ncbi:MAG: MarR family transcriptional regulator [Phycisphaerales bacterium]|nr:MarR family transcriptional regulator [Phycisphaerales bacterium]